jgi:penicillin amidase
MATMKRRWLRLGGALVAGLLALALGGGYLALRTSLPKTSGTIVLAGLGAEVEVLRDANGIPHIFAASRDDAYFALGFVHAQDRLWQMEARRRIGAGRLSEILGPRTIKTDRFFRTLGIARVAERNVAALDSETRAALVAYAAGVNAFLAGRRGLLPPEFLLLGAPAPEAWRPADSIVVLKLMALRLSRNWRNEMLRARLARRLSAAQIEELWPPYPDDGPVALPAFAPPDGAKLYRRLPLDALWARTPPGAPGGVGSNNWVVAGGRSETGKPLLANDTHLGLSAPGTFYLAHLNAPGLNVVGATLPGLPLVVLGRNDRVAWGFTNTSPDTQDLFIERVDPGDESRYLAPGGSRPFTTRREIIRVDGADDVILTVRESRHGPIISDVSSSAADVTQTGEALAFAWTALRDDDLTPQAGLKLTRARDWTGFVAALRDYHGPQQNIVYADVDGNIGFYAPALVPIRKSGDGRAPVPGWTGEHDWIGFVPFEALPHAFNPANGRIVTANNKIVPDSYPYLITRDWEASYRARRITELIDRRPRHTPESFREIQADVTSLMARDMLPHLLRARPGTEAARAARALVEGWDGEMARDKPEPLIFSAWYRELTRLVYADELGPLFDDAWGPRPLFLRWVLEGGGERWCDDVKSAGVESCAEISARALDAAAAELAARHGDDPRRWRWGEAHYADHAHGVFSDLPLLGSWFGVRLANGGDSFTINAANYAMGDRERRFVQIHGPTFRAIYDLADLERSLFVLAVGQSGNPLSPYYRDQAERWRDHRPFPIPTRREAVEAAAVERLALVPE